MRIRMALFDNGSKNDEHRIQQPLGLLPLLGLTLWYFLGPWEGTRRHRRAGTRVVQATRGRLDVQSARALSTGGEK